MNWNQKFEDLITFVRAYYWIAFIPLVIYAFISLQIEKEDIAKNKSTTYGIVKRSRPVAKQFSKRYYDYEFKVAGQRFSGSSIGRFSDNISKGNYYLVEFSTNNPEHNQMDFEVGYSRKIVKNENGRWDTIFIPTSEMKLELPTDLNDRLDKLKSKTKTEQNLD